MDENTIYTKFHKLKNDGGQIKVMEYAINISRDYRYGESLKNQYLLKLTLGPIGLIL